MWYLCGTQGHEYLERDGNEKSSQFMRRLVYYTKNFEFGGVGNRIVFLQGREN